MTTSPEDQADPLRLINSDDDLERLLVRSAKLDDAEVESRRELRAASMARARQILDRTRVSPALVGLGLCLAAAAAIPLVLRLTREDAPLPRAEEMAPRPAPSSAASARPAPSVPAPAPAPALEPCPSLVVADGSAPLIDDFEDRNARMLLQDGRSGHWFANGEPKAKQKPRAGTTAFPVPIPNGREQSRFALHFVGGQTQFGAGIEGHFAGRRACYDASRYAGIEFWAKGPGRIQVMLPMIDMIERKWGGLCETNCYDAHRKILVLSSKWQRFSFRWEEVAQLGYGLPLRFDEKRLWSVHFWLESADTPFDVWIDDVAFLPREPHAPSSP